MKKILLLFLIIYCAFAEFGSDVIFTDSTQKKNNTISKSKEVMVYECGGKINLVTIYFMSGSSELDIATCDSLDYLARKLDEYPLVKIEINGHADNVECHQDRQLKKLSYKRAKKVMKYLLDRGVELSRLRIIGSGNDYPIAPRESEEGRSRNRRVEIIRID